MIIIIIIIIIIINWYSHIPKPVTEHEDVTVLWNQGIQTHREVLANRPDLIIKNTTGSRGEVPGKKENL
jgi:hypothetical protein